MTHKDTDSMKHKYEDTKFNGSQSKRNPPLHNHPKSVCGKYTNQYLLYFN